MSNILLAHVYSVYDVYKYLYSGKWYMVLALTYTS